MKNQFNLIGKVAILSVLVIFSSCSGPKNSKFNDDSAWKLSPDQNGPYIVSKGHVRGVYIGRDQNGNHGAENSKVSQTFKCSNRNGNWCVISLNAIMEQRDKERVKITVSDGASSETGYLKHEGPAVNNHRFSFPNCGEVTLTMEMSKGDTAKLQSLVLINDISTYCSDKKVMIMMENEAGQELTVEDQ